MTLALTAPKLPSSSNCHILFADKACEEECQKYQNILYTYEIVSEQRVNLQKSSVAFIRHMDMNETIAVG